ncbi:YdcH family protein [Marilutibacter chinensis]|uniref:YdcH family protein n=1 Tax=Marilutibacter chinensis TaxID=2912247 RepID=A0ABS9HS54_9GAMM|nr:YdcH family protein [Lysobacter chinensis]MCF7221761.1 YdcH family protein [Lysobacter chinensis]
MLETDDPAVIARRLAELRIEHRDLDAAIERLASLRDGDPHDDLALKRMKKRKLWLKDCIARLESALIPDEPA